MLTQRAKRIFVRARARAGELSSGREERRVDCGPKETAEKESGRGEKGGNRPVRHFSRVGYALISSCVSWRRRRLECAPDEPAGPTLTPAEKIAQLKAKKEAAEAKKLAEKKMKDKEFQERQRRAKEELAKKNGVVKEHGDGSGVMWIG
jgi:hypothetical protein